MNNTIFYVLVGILVGGLLLPMSVYLCVRMGVLGYLRAKQRFNQQVHEEEKNGNPT